MGTPKAALNNPEYFIEKGRMGGRPTWQETLAKQRHPKKRKGNTDSAAGASAGGLPSFTYLAAMDGMPVEPAAIRAVVWVPGRDKARKEHSLASGKNEEVECQFQT